MNSFEDIPHDSQLHAFLDGELDGAQEDGMLARISADPELQRHYNDLLEIRSAMKADAQSLRVPPDATMAVFSALGFTVSLSPSSPSPMAGIQPTATPGTAGPRSSRSWLTVALIMASLVTIILFVFLRGNGVPVPAGASRSQAELRRGSSRNAGDITNAAPSAAESSGGGIVAAPPASTLKAGSRAGRGAAARRSDNLLSTDVGADTPTHPPLSETSADAAGQIDQDRSAAETAARDAMPEDAIPPATDTQSQGSPQQTIEQLLAKAEPPTALGLRFTLRGMASTSSPAATIGSQTNTDARNIAFGLDIALSERQHLGIAMGREAFSQHYGRVEQGRYITYEQNPLEYWIAAYYERTLAAFMPNKLFLYTRFDAGSVLQLGPMLRGSLGVRLNLTPRFGALLAGEGTLAGYKNQSIWLTTKKIGGTAGLFIAF